MGSILILAFIQIVFIVIGSLMKLFRCNCCCNWAKKTFDMNTARNDSLNLIHGTFFEIMVCASVSMSMLKYSDYFVDSDKVSVGLQFFFAAILCAYVLFVTFFTIFKTGLWKVMT